MKIILATIVLTGFTMTAFADTTFKTIAQAEAHCPAAINGLTYNQGEARITGSHGTQFTSFRDIEGSVVPRLLNNQHIITDAAFRNGGIGIGYGYMTDDNHVACLYSYQTITGDFFMLSIQNF